MKLFIFSICIVAATCELAQFVGDQTELIRESWNQVKHNEVDILYAIFAANPDIQARFPQFAKKDLKTLKSSSSFASHAGRIVGFFSKITELNPNDSGVSAAKTLINQVAASHKGRGVSKAQFNAFRVSLTAYLADHVSWDDNVAQAWEKGLDNVYLVLFSAFDGNPME